MKLNFHRPAHAFSTDYEVEGAHAERAEAAGTHMSPDTSRRLASMPEGSQGRRLAGLTQLQTLVGNRASSRLAAKQDTIRQAARDGVRSPGGPIPHLDKVQAAFGRHDVSSIEAHAGPTASGAAQLMKAKAYAMGSHVAFGDSSPSLHTVAHEVAHVIQQRSGISIPGGVGAAGDRHERQADAVADAVVQGQSVEGMLGTASTEAPSAVSESGPIQQNQNDAMRLVESAIVEYRLSDSMAEMLRDSVFFAGDAGACVGNLWYVKEAGGEWSKLPKDFERQIERAWAVDSYSATDVKYKGSTKGKASKVKYNVTQIRSDLSRGKAVGKFEDWMRVWLLPMVRDRDSMASRKGSEPEIEVGVAPLKGSGRAALKGTEYETVHEITDFVRGSLYFDTLAQAEAAYNSAVKKLRGKIQKPKDKFGDLESKGRMPYGMLVYDMPMRKVGAGKGGEDVVYSVPCEVQFHSKGIASVKDKEHLLYEVKAYLEDESAEDRKVPQALIVHAKTACAPKGRAIWERAAPKAWPDDKISSRDQTWVSDQVKEALQSIHAYANTLTFKGKTKVLKQIKKYEASVDKKGHTFA